MSHPGIKVNGFFEDGFSRLLLFAWEQSALSVSSFYSSLNYNLTADVAKKEKSQQPRVYFVTSGETAGQITEKLQLSFMQEKCEHYLAYVKVSSFMSFLTLALLHSTLKKNIQPIEMMLLWFQMFDFLIGTKGLRKAIEKTDLYKLPAFFDRFDLKETSGKTEH
ncbi:hypothetical protein DV515_00001841 [Chloebia gouldiae]|uniref:Integrin alpha first immunoglubulin-like domain-containing protein n=1 Tax=Chloebia gouldiae TaxID=44316 RepID=A0A3L8SXJ2_CHLGU|nr:hypothetical protein DV515_00001841 [Chloebia gouldiae]